MNKHCINILGEKSAIVMNSINIFLFEQTKINEEI